MTTLRPHDLHRQPPQRPSRQGGFGVIAALVLVVMLAAFSAALMRISVSQQAVATQDMMATNAWLAAKSGADWGLYQAMKGTWQSSGTTLCTTPKSQTLDLTSDTGMSVTVTCTAVSFNEGESTPGTPNASVIIEVKATACTSASCPDPAKAVQSTYVERTRQVQVQK